MAWKNSIYYKEEEEKLPKEAEVSFQEPESASFDGAAWQEKKPVYEDRYGDRIDRLLEDLEQREDFSYDAERDPLYQQYRTQYRREGERAAEDVLADVAAHAGGMNSYAVTAARQAGDYYNAKLMDVLPELADLAYRRWQADYDEDLDLLKQLQSREKEEYGRYQDALSDWREELDAAYREYLDSEASRPEPDPIEQKNEQMGNQWADVTEKDAVAELANADYYQAAINAAVRGDRAGAEAALAKRAEKMAAPDYHGTGGGTSMESARGYIDGLLEASEDADIPETAASEMLSKAQWKTERANGSGPEADYATYEDYVSDYLRYLTEVGV